MHQTGTYLTLDLSSSCIQMDALGHNDRNYRKEIRMVRHVTHMLYDYQICNGVSHCVKNGS